MSAPNTERTGETREPAVGSMLALVIAWAVVGIPAAWGVAQTVIKSLAPFR